MTEPYRSQFIVAGFELLDKDVADRVFMPVVPLLHESFFTAATSSTGKHHPEFSNGEGGLVRHSIAVATLTNHLCMQLKIDGKRRQAAILAAFLHDCAKGQAEPFAKEWGFSTKFHNKTSADFWMLCASDFVRLEDEWFEKFVRNVDQAIRGHMAHWTEQDAVEIPALMRAGDHVAVAVATADYICSFKGIDFPGIK